MRSGSAQVLTVGDLVFSSDPRLKVVSLTRRWQNVGVWILKVSQANEGDSGRYQCQVKGYKYRKILNYIVFDYQPSSFKFS